MRTNRERWMTILTGQFELCLETDEYAMAKSRYTPEELAEKMTSGLLNGTADKDGKAIRNTCKVLGLKNTYKAIKEYLQG